jgi:Cu-processing system ATP-binding protein
VTSHVLSDLDDLVTEVIYMQDGKLCFHQSIELLRQDTGEQKLAKAIASIMIENN